MRAHTARSAPPKARARIVHAGAVVAMCSLLATGCGDDGPAATPRLADSELRTQLSQPEKDLLYLAEQELISSCMRERGFRYTVVPPRKSADTAPEPRPFGNDDVAWARSHGYGLSEAATAGADGANGDGKGAEARPQGPNGRYLASLGPAQKAAFQRALDGTNPAAITVRIGDRGSVFTSADGCQAEAREHLYGDLRTWTRAKATVVNLAALTRSQLDSDSRWTAAQRDWRACMAKRGLPYRSPQDAMDAAAADGRREREIAVADARCNRDSALATTGADTERRIIRAAARGPHRDAVTGYTLAVNRALPEARRITHLS
ncbi:hypothetical protein [Streptomyces sp. NPDC093568]|uniref:hypothetical protein n=1 Tax=Streptomyces sp. NPDC093568 TaxID=3366041 RepID=UPI00382148DD